MLELRLLGSIDIRVGKTHVGAAGRDKALVLLAYLAATAGRPHMREHLAESFWPAMPRERALHNLRQALLRLRDLLPASENVLAAKQHTVVFVRDSDHWIDLEPFFAPAADDAVPAMERRAALYRGSFLDDLACETSERFAQWVAQRRGHCRRMALAIEGSLATRHENAGRLDLALEHARRLVALEPWNETGQRRLLRLLALAGQAEAALSHFDALRADLRHELNAEVQDATFALAERIRTGRSGTVGVEAPSLVVDEVEAARKYLSAARRAGEQAAYSKTAELAERASSLLETVPEHARSPLELEALLLGASAHVSIGGYFDARARRLHEQACDLALRPDSEPRQAIAALRGHWIGVSSRSSHGEAKIIAARMIRIADTAQLPWLRGVARYLAGNSALWLGEFDAALALLSAAVDILRVAPPDPDVLFAHEQDFEATAIGYLGWVHWHLGRSNLALELGRRAMRRAQRSGHVPTWMHTAVSFCSIAIGERLTAQVVETSSAILQRAERHDMAMWRDIGLLQRHWACARTGDASHAAAARDAIERLAIVYPGGAAGFHAMFAESCLYLGDRKALRHSLASLRNSVRNTGAGAFRAALARLEAEQARLEGRLQRASTGFQRAIEIAILQGSPALEKLARRAAQAQPSPGENAGSGAAPRAAQVGSAGRAGRIRRVPNPIDHRM